MLSGGSWVQIPAGSTTRVFKQTGETDDRVIGGGWGGGGEGDVSPLALYFSSFFH